MTLHHPPLHQRNHAWIPPLHLRPLQVPGVHQTHHLLSLALLLSTPHQTRSILHLNRQTTQTGHVEIGSCQRSIRTPPRLRHLTAPCSPLLFATCSFLFYIISYFCFILSDLSTAYRNQVLPDNRPYLYVSRINYIS
jgi:hypothetical protein